MIAYCDRKSVEFHETRFAYDGVALISSRTPDEVPSHPLMSPSLHIHTYVYARARVHISIYLCEFVQCRIYFWPMSFQNLTEYLLLQYDLESGDVIDVFPGLRGGGAP